MADLDILTAAGFDLAALTDDQKSAVNRLTPEELASLASIRAKLNEEPEVSGHLARAAGDGNFVW